MALDLRTIPRHGDDIAVHTVDGPVPHGGVDPVEVVALGLAPEEVLDFSTNVNPFGPPPSVVAAVRDAVTASRLARYPDRTSRLLRERLAQVHQVHPGQVLVGNGSAELIHLAMRMWGPGARVAVFSPTFGEYAHAARLAGASLAVVAWPGWEQGMDGRFRPGTRTLDHVVTELAGLRPDLVVVCNPNNPTGDLIAGPEWHRLQQVLPQALWLVDTAYMPFVDTPVPVRPDERTFVLGSLTKDFALAGLRLGYLLGSTDRIARLVTAQPPWSINALAQTAGLAALEELEWRQATLAALRTARDRLWAGMRAQGWQPRPSSTAFFLLPVTHPARFRQALLRQGILVRDATSFDLEGYVRIAVRTPPENERLLEALAALRDAFQPRPGGGI